MCGRDDKDGSKQERERARRGKGYYKEVVEVSSSLRFVVKEEERKGRKVCGEQTAAFKRWTRREAGIIPTWNSLGLSKVSSSSSLRVAVDVD